MKTFGLTTLQTLYLALYVYWSLDDPSKKAMHSDRAKAQYVNYAIWRLYDCRKLIRKSGASLFCNSS